MEDFVWGLLGSRKLTSTRRARDLGQASVVRYFNDQAVPGMGGIWYGKQLVLALLGIRLAELSSKSSHSNIKVTNGVEALACWIAYSSNDFGTDSRLRGRLLLQKHSGKLPAFKALTQAGGYVSQPMRMASSQPLKALGLVEMTGSLFNSFSCSEQGVELLKKAGFNEVRLGYLNKWVEGGNVRWKRGDRKSVENLLSPSEPLNKVARQIIESLLLNNNSDSEGQNRRNAYNWVRDLAENNRETQVVFNPKPKRIDDEHWKHIEAGARFEILRKAALSLLDDIEVLIYKTGKPANGLKLDKVLLEKIVEPLENVRKQAKRFSELSFNFPEHVSMGHSFVSLCAADNKELIRELAKLDDRVIRYDSENLMPGPASRSPNGKTADSQTGETENIRGYRVWPEGISERLPNLFHLGIDLQGELEDWL